jgi:hypothetical protein
MNRCFLALFVGATWLASCGDITVVGPTNKTVGSACTANTDCAQMCLQDGHFPAGMCTIACTSNANCPSGSACVTEEGGVCLATCHADADCAPFNASFVCHSETTASGAALGFCRAP